MMRRSLLILSLLGALTLPLFAAANVRAQVEPFDDVCDSETANSPVCQTDGDDPIAGNDGVILRVVEILSFVIGIAAVIMLLLGGLKYVTSGGDSNATASAKNTILYAIIGILVSLISYAIIIFVIRRL